MRVLAGLRRLHEGDAIAKQGWTLFLQSGTSRDDKPRLFTLIARRLAKMPPSLLEELVTAVAYWLERNCKPLLEVDRDAAESLLDLLTSSVAANPDEYLRKAASTDGERDWFEDAWNSAVRPLVEVLFADPQLSEAAGGLPGRMDSARRRAPELAGRPWSLRADPIRSAPEFVVRSGPSMD